LRISRALGRPRSMTGRQGLEGVTLAVGLEVEGFRGGVMGESEESEEDDSSLSLHEDISCSVKSRERLQSGDEVGMRENSESAGRELA
jgi:hypothetical protein